MKKFDFSAEKNAWLEKNRGICFEEVIIAIESGFLMDVVRHPNAEKYGNQKLYVVNINNYAYAVPFVEEGEQRIFLKTAFRSRKLTKRYLENNVEEMDHE